MISLKVDLGEIKKVYTVATQGYRSSSYYTLIYNVQYSADGNNFKYIEDSTGGHKVRLLFIYFIRKKSVGKPSSSVYSESHIRSSTFFSVKIVFRDINYSTDLKCEANIMKNTSQYLFYIRFNSISS